MLIKKSSILLRAYTSLHSLPTASGSSTSSLSRRRESTRQRACRRREQSGYATLAGESQDQDTQQSHGQAERPWPKSLEGQSSPTPYQILAMKHNAIYTKARFYEMVKLYHPDLSKDSALNKAAHQVKMERYRLIVAAHTILSDPVRRSAYDRLGAGWDGKADVGVKENGHAGSQPGPFSRSWSDPADPIWQNATWEDWERFHARKAQEQGTAEGGAKEQQTGVYMQNSYFFVLVVILAMVGSSMNYNRAQDAGVYFVEQRDLVHDRAAKELRRVRQDISGMGKEEKIQWFLRQREATMGQMAGSDIEAMREERANRLLPDREVCRSEDIREKDT
ncbi:hypothetical protein LTR36_007676 [Oleoguttula mirabilis]|uniref:J domain-containing protein n=1 Tax=Oleoguttula mirabilis TaxID=1507867 RepID=A0AAV9JUK5_9PEZI|nr:hypothetical protein LTR36_007676 [Oleoguttula mirabilis]